MTGALNPYSILFFAFFGGLALLPFWGLFIIWKNFKDGEAAKFRTAETMVVTGVCVWSLALGALYALKSSVYGYLFLLPIVYGLAVGGTAAWRAYSGWRRALELAILAGLVFAPVLLISISAPYFIHARERSEKRARLAAVVPEYSKPGVTPAELVPGLVFVLKNPDKDLRLEALRALRGVGDGYLPGLSYRVAPDPGALAQAIPALLECLKDPDQWVREAAADALRYAGPGSAPGIMAMLRAADPHARAGAALALSGLSSLDLSFIPAITAMLADPDAGVRLNGAKAAAKFGTLSPQAEQTLAGPLGAMLEETGTEPRAAALEALSKLSPAQLSAAAPGILKNLKAPEDHVRFTAFRLAGKIRPVPAGLPDALREPLRGGDDRLCAFALGAAGDLGPQAAPLLDELISVAEKNKSLRYAAVYALGETGPAAARALPMVLKFKDDPDKTVAMRAREAEVKMRRP